MNGLTRNPILRLAVLAAPLLSLAGCLQVETRIKLEPDGSATITEKIRFSQRLLDLSSTAAKELKLDDRLSRDAAEQRVAHMGEGIKLVSHEVNDAEKGAREAVNVFKIPDIRSFQYVSPFLAYSDYSEHTALKAHMVPCLEDTWYGRRAGQLAVTFKAVAKSSQRDPRKDEDRPKEPNPAQVQVLRALQPVFIDMLEGFRVRIVFESYARLRFRQYYRYRGMRSGTHEFDLVDVAHDDLDNYSQRFIENEEVLLELLRGKLHYPNVLDHTAQHGTNNTLPVYHAHGVPEIYFNPSKALFDREFVEDGKPKTLTPDKRRGDPRPADFARIGWDPKRDRKDEGEDE